MISQSNCAEKILPAETSKEEVSRFESSKFEFTKSFQFDPDMVLDILDGKRAGVIFPGLIHGEHCTEVVRNFWSHPERYHRDNDVPAHYVGAYHYGKSLNEYFDECDNRRTGMASLAGTLGNPIQTIIAQLAARSATRGIGLRLARWKSRLASPFVARSWTDVGDFTLRPHEDEAQLETEAQAEFEIQQVAGGPVVALNICVEAEGGGSLFYWNMKPGRELRERLDLLETGYPYPVEALQGYPQQEIQIRTGDVYCFDGRAIHAVGPVDGKRTTLSCMLGKISETQIVYWS